jgi:hypothetical protein
MMNLNDDNAKAATFSPIKQLTALALLALPMLAAEAVQPKVYIAPADGAETYVSAAIMKKRVPVTVVTDPAQADYTLEITSQSQKAGWAKIIIARDLRSTEDESIRLIDNKTNAVAFAYSYHMQSSYFGKQSAAESCAKHLGQWLKAGR